MRKLEKVTLHFDLSHVVADHTFKLKAHGKHHTLKRHDHASRRKHAETNAAVALLLAEGLDETITHYVEEVELPSDAVSFNWVGYPSQRPGAVVDEIGVVFQYIPRAAVAEAVLAMQRDGQLMRPARFSRMTQTATAKHDPVTLHQDAGLFISSDDSAMTLLMQHPDIGTTDPALLERIETLVSQRNSFVRLSNFIYRHPAEHPTDPWFYNGIVTDDDGNPMEPVVQLDDGQEIPWPTLDGTSVSVIPQFELSAGLDDVLGAAVKDIGTLIKQQPWLKGRQWSTLHGVTEVSRTEVVPTVAEAVLSEQAAAEAQWALSSKTSMYGLNLFQESMRFDAASNTMTFDVKNWPNRGLGVYVQFLDLSGNPIAFPGTWTERLPDHLRGEFQSNSTKKYLQYLGAGTAFYGVPVWAPKVPISFTVPVNAAGARVLFGGLGNGNWDMEVDKIGVIYTCCVSYGIPSLLTAMSIGVRGTSWYKSFFDDPENVVLLVAAATAAFGPIFAVGTQVIGIEATLVKTAKFVAGILFSKALSKLATKVLTYVAAEQVAQNAPFVGWALKVVSMASAIADMTATSIEVGLSPATYELQLKRSMTLNVRVGPDVTHGMWPENSDNGHYVIQVQYTGGTTLKKTGPMPTKHDAPIEVCYSTATDDALPSAPSEKFQVIAAIYSNEDVLWGKWVSGWITAVPTDGSTRSETGSITETLAKLLPTTTYRHKSTLSYDAGRRNYLWADGDAPVQTRTSLSRQGVTQLVNLTLNNLAAKLGYCYLADHQNMPLDYQTAAQPGAMFVFQSISTLPAPGDGLLAPTRGFSVQPCIAFDQFGPAALFTLDPSDRYQADLDKLRGPTISLRSAFAQNGFPLPDGMQVTVKTASAAWQIGPVGGPPMYDLRRQTDVIKVFTAPVPDFSPNNFYLDTRTYQASGGSHLRLVDLSGKSAGTFDYSQTKSWGVFGMANLNAIAIHPNGYAIAISYKDNKMAILELPSAGVADQDAPQALPFCGAGQREGLLGGPVSMTISADGRILVLEQTNARIQAFDTFANPVQCFKAELTFDVPAEMVKDLNGGIVSLGLLQALQRNVPVENRSGANTDPRYLLKPVFSLKSNFSETLNAGVVTEELCEAFEENAWNLDANATILQTAPGIWLVHNASDGMNFDVRWKGEGLDALDVYRCFAPTILVKAPNSEWLLMDKANTLTFSVTAAKGAGQALKCCRLTSLMPLRTDPAAVTYLDVAVEAKGFIYVLSFINDGKTPADYRLDIYNPDGSPLTRQAGSHNGQVNAAHMMVDQWRTLFTLNYEQMKGPGERLEPTLSRWIPQS